MLIRYQQVFEEYKRPDKQPKFNLILNYPFDNQVPAGDEKSTRGEGSRGKKSQGRGNPAAGKKIST